MKITLKGLSLAIASVGMLTIYGCGGGSDPAPLTPTSMTVAPSLGKFSKGTSVKLRRIDLTELATGSIGDDGKAILTFSGYAGPIVIEVLGGADVKYYDEGKKVFVSFGTNKMLRAVAPAAQAEVGVTALTNAAVVKLEAAGTLKDALAATVNTANTNVATAVKTLLGLSEMSILQAPTLVDDKTGKTLVAGSLGDKYAIALATLAKTATGTNATTGQANSAVDVAEGLARDLKDDKLDGVDTTSSTPSEAITSAPTSETITTGYKEATAELAETSSQTELDKTYDDSIIAAGIGGSNAGSPAGGGGDSAPAPVSDLALAKALFSELRTTLQSFSNGSTGFLDTQATRINADLNANVTPELSKVASRISTLGMAMSMFEDGKAYTSSNTFGLVAGTAPNNGPAALVRENGSLQAVWNGYGSYDYCWTDFATGVTNKVSCSHAGIDSADWANNRIKFVVYELTSPAANQFSYTATRYNRSVTLLNGLINALGTPTLATVPTGSGTLTKTVSGSTMTGLTINGTLTPSASSATGTLVTGVDTIAIAAARSALSAANNFRYAVSGSVATTNLADSTKVVSLSIDSGSYVDVDESNVNTTGAKPVAMKLVGTAQTTATKFTGTLDVGAFMNDADGFDYSPTSIAFNGSVWDTSTGGAGEMLLGKLEAAVADYNLYHSAQPQSATNYKKATVTFTGTVQAPSRPALKLVVAGVKTGVSTGTVTVDYSYGTVKITGSGATSATGNTLTLSNQAGVQVLLDTQGAGTVTKSGATLATIANGMINYTDGVSESLN